MAPFIAEDLLLLLLDDEKGIAASSWVDSGTPLATAPAEPAVRSGRRVRCPTRCRRRGSRS